MWHQKKFSLSLKKKLNKKHKIFLGWKKKGSAKVKGNNVSSIKGEKLTFKLIYKVIRNFVCLVEKSSLKQSHHTPPTVLRPDANIKFVVFQLSLRENRCLEFIAQTFNCKSWELFLKLEFYNFHVLKSWCNSTRVARMVLLVWKIRFIILLSL